MIRRQENINSLIEALQYFRRSGSTKAALDYVSKNGGVFIVGTTQHKETLLRSGKTGKATIFAATELSSRGYQGLQGPAVVDHHAVEILAGISKDFIGQIQELKSHNNYLKTSLELANAKLADMKYELDTHKAVYSRWRWLVNALNRIFVKRNKRKGK